MNIKYKNYSRQFVTEQQIQNIDRYYKSFFDANNVLIKEELYSEKKLMALIYYNSNNENHQTIISNNSSVGYTWVNIIEYKFFSEYKLEKVFEYDIDGTEGGIALNLYDLNSELISYGHKDVNGIYDYSITHKLYYDRNINPERELFVCTYQKNTGALLELYWNNYHIDSDGHEAIVLFNTPADIQTLITLTGMSQQVAEYYMISEIIPNF